MPSQQTSASDAPIHIPPRLEDLNDRELAKLAFVAVLSRDDPKLLHLATILDFEELVTLIVAFEGKSLLVPHPSIFEELRGLVLATHAVHRNRLSNKDAAHFYHSAPKAIATVLRVAEPPLAVFQEFSRKMIARENKRRYRAGKKRYKPFHEKLFEAKQT